MSNNKWLIDCNKVTELPRERREVLFGFLNSVVMKQKLLPDEHKAFYEWLNEVSGKYIKVGSCPDCIGHTISGLRMAIKQSFKDEASRIDNSGNTQGNTAERVQESEAVHEEGEAQ